MSRMRREIVQCMSDLKRSGEGVSARFRFPASFVGFQGHFPEKKILPGVCQIQCALSAVEESYRRPVNLREAVLVKFYAPVEPDQEVVCVCAGIPEASDGDFTLKAAMSSNGRKISEMKLRVCYGE